MIYIDTKSTDVYYNFGVEYYFSREKNLGDAYPDDRQISEHARGN